MRFNFLNLIELKMVYHSQLFVSEFVVITIDSNRT